MPHAAGLIPDAQQLPDHLCDACQRPVVFCIALSAGTFLQRSFQLFQLSRRQAAGTSRLGCVLFSAWASPRRLLPALHAAYAGGDRAGWLPWVLAWSLYGGWCV